ncbi:MAG: 2-phosphosulfolactate phosphatase [Alphaproteobacteria bacterium]
MRIANTYGVDAAAVARGTVIVIDVLRAFTTAAYAFDAGAARIVLVGDPAEGFALKARWPDAVLVGEDGGRQIAGFDVGNSPEAVEAMDLTGKTIVLRSSSGTQGVVGATGAEAIWLGSLVVASATVRALQDRPLVTILAMGSRNGPDGPEDVACQRYMASLFAGVPVARDEIRQAVIDSPSGQWALDPAIGFKTPGDLDRAVAIDRFDFAMPVTREDGLLVAHRVDMSDV